MDNTPAPSPRGFIGYGANPPRVTWPDNAHIAVHFLPPFELNG